MIVKLIKKRINGVESVKGLVKEVEVEQYKKDQLEHLQHMRECAELEATHLAQTIINKVLLRNFHESEQIH